MFVGQNLRAEAEQLIGCEGVGDGICGLCTIGVGMIRIVGKASLMVGKLRDVWARAVLALKVIINIIL
jgi:hypothetical protein